MEYFKEQEELQDLTHATAHLIHGSSEGRFKITYAPGHLTKDEVEGVNFGYLDYQEAIARYNPDQLQDGFNTMPGGEEIYFISTPSARLRTTKDKLNGQGGSTKWDRKQKSNLSHFHRLVFIAFETDS